MKRSFSIDYRTISDDAVVLDAGCGSGNLSFAIAERVPNGHVIAIDLSESMIEKFAFAKK